MILKFKRPASKDYKTGEDIDIEVEVSQEELDRVFRERMDRKEKKHAEDLASITAERDKAIEKAEKAAAKLTDAEKAKLEAEEKAKKTSEESAKEIALAKKEKLALSLVQAAGIQLPKVYADSIKIDDKDDDESIAKKVKDVIATFKADIKQHGGKAMGSTENGGGGEGDHGFSDSELLAMAKKQYPTIARQGDQEALRIMRLKAKDGELKKAA